MGGNTLNPKQSETKQILRVEFVKNQDYMQKKLLPSILRGRTPSRPVLLSQADHNQEISLD